MPRPPQSSGWTLDNEYAFIDALAQQGRHAPALLRGYVRGLERRTFGFGTPQNPRPPMNEGARGQLRGRALVWLNDLVGA